MTTDNGSTAILQQSGEVLGKAGVDMVMIAHDRVISSKTMIGHNLDKGLITLLINVGFQGAAEITDFAVSQ